MSLVAIFSKVECFIRTKLRIRNSLIPCLYFLDHSLGDRQLVLLLFLWLNLILIQHSRQFFVCFRRVLLLVRHNLNIDKASRILTILVNWLSLPVKLGPSSLTWSHLIESRFLAFGEESDVLWFRSCLLHCFILLKHWSLERIYRLFISLFNDRFQHYALSA